MRDVAKAEVQKQFTENEKKWSPTLMKAGFTVLPSIILERQRALGLDAIDVNILLHLAKHWWYADNVPHPSKRAIAECMQIDISTVRRRIASMERDGLIRRVARYDSKVGGQMTNTYHFDGLINKAQPFAEELIESRRQQQKEAADRRTRKRPLSIAKMGEE